MMYKRTLKIPAHHRTDKGESKNLNKTLEKISRNSKKIKRKNGSFCLDLLSFISNVYPYTNGKFCVEHQNGQLEVFYKNIGYSPRPILLPRFIKLTEEFFESIGLYIAEGQTSMRKNSRRQTKFSNSDPELISFFLKFLRSFNIQKESLFTEIQVHEASKVSEKEIKSYWSNVTGILKERLSVRRMKSRSRNPKRFKPYGTLHVMFNSTIFKFLLMKIIKFIRKIVEENRPLAILVVRGIAAGEGSVELWPPTGCLHRVSISAVHRENRRFIKNLLYKVGINKTSKNATDILIYNYFNLMKLDEIDIFALCSSKRKLFKKGLYKLKRSKHGVPGMTQDRIKKVLERLNKPLSGKSLSSYLHYDYKRVMRELNKLEKRELVKRIKRNTNRRNVTNYLWEISSKG